MRLVAWQVIIDDDGFRRIIEVVLDLLDLRNFVELGDVQRAVPTGVRVWIAAGGTNLHRVVKIAKPTGSQLSERSCGI
jgi:hypothetical protein